MPRGADAVAEATDRRNNIDRYQHTWSLQQPFLHGALESGIQSSRVAHRGIAGGEGLLQYRRRPHMSGALRFIEPPAMGEAVTMAGEMVVAIDQARE
jgi:hypothetical protein